MCPEKRQAGLLMQFLYPGLPAMAFFLVLSVLLFRPFPVRGNPWTLLLPLNSFLAALGCFALSRRWLDSFWASAVAGIAYGFGPFLLSFRLYHPLAGLSIAALPWLFCPAAFWHRYAKPSLSLTVRRFPLLLLPFAFLFLFYGLSAQSRFGPYHLMPSTQQISRQDLLSLLEFPAAPAEKIIIGLYANTLIPAVMGLFVYSFLLRVLVLLPPLAGLILAASPPILNVPPIVWMAVPMLFLSVLAGLGMQAMAVAGAADRKWIFACLLLSALLTAVCVFLALVRPDGQAYRNPAWMYGLAFVSTGTVFLLCKFEVRFPLLRWIVLGAAVGADLFCCGRSLITSL